MALIPTREPTVNNDGFIDNGSNLITINDTISAVNKNEPIFAVANEQLVGYVAVELYEQHQASTIEKKKPTNEGQKKDSSIKEIYTGIEYASGKPYVTSSKVWATGADASISN